MGRYARSIDNLGCFLAFVAAGSLSATAAAAPEGDGVAGAKSATELTPPQFVDEVVVTATKRAASLLEVPLAVTAISGDALTETGVLSIDGLTRLDPAFQVNAKAPGDTQIIMRGLQSAGASMVSVYMDEAVVTGDDFEGNGGRQLPLQLYDVDRVEILKGPQGTLFGAGSMGGTVRVLTNQPDLRNYGFSMGASGAGGSGVNPLYDVWGAANLPVISDELALRVVAWSDSGGGWIDRRDNPRSLSNTNDEHISGGRAIGTWQALDDLKVTFTAVTQSTVVDDGSAYRMSLGPYLNGDVVQDYLDDQYKLYSVVGEYRLPLGTITASSSRTQRNTFDKTDVTPTAQGFLGLPGNYAGNELQNLAVWSSELRFASNFPGPFQLVSGVFYEQDRDTRSYSYAAATVGGFNSPCTMYQDCVDSGNAADVIAAISRRRDTDHYAIYAQGDYAITNALTFTAGARLYRAQLSWSDRQDQSLRFSLSDPVQSAPRYTDYPDSTQRNTSYNFSLDWRPVDQLALYARAASGFRLGGLTSASTRALDPTVPLSYKSDALWNYELGAKWSGFEHKVSVDASVFRLNWSDMQVTRYSSIGVGSYLGNAGKARVNGAELQATVRPLKGLSVSLGATFTDAKLTEDQPGVAQDDATAGRNGDPVPLVPRWTYTGLVRQEFPLLQRVGYVQGSFNYRGAEATNFHAGDYYIALPSYFLLDLAAGMTFDHWDAGIFVQNVTDRVAVTGAVALDGTAFGDANLTSARPRMFGIRFTAHL